MKLHSKICKFLKLNDKIDRHSYFPHQLNLNSNRPSLTSQWCWCYAICSLIIILIFHITSSLYCYLKHKQTKSIYLITCMRHFPKGISTIPQRVLQTGSNQFDVNFQLCCKQSCYTEISESKIIKMKKKTSMF